MTTTPDRGWQYDPAAHGSEGHDYDEPEVSTQVLSDGDFLREPIRTLIEKQRPGRFKWREPIYLVTHGRWSGYSEYTITSTWDEVHVHHAGVDLHWEGVGAFMRDLTDANAGEDS